MAEPNRKYRAAIIGTGLICPFHIAGIRRSGLAEVVALCDINRAQATKVAEQHRIEHVLDRVADLQDLAVDVVHVATPPDSHFALTMQALNLGCHVFVEKPLATSVEQCHEIERRSLEVNRQVCANHSNLLDPFVARAIGKARAGSIGEVQSVTYLRGSNYPPYRGGLLPPHYREGGFPFRDIGVHALYLIHALLGKIKNVDACFAHRGADPNLMFDDWTGTVACEQGTGLFHLSWNIQPLQNVLIIAGTRGVIRCDPFSMFVTTRRKNRLPNAVDRMMLPMLEACQISTQVPWNMGKALMGRLRRYHGVEAMIESFYRCLHDGLPLGVSLADATEMVRWTEHVAQQADDAKHKRLARIPAVTGADVLVTGGTGFIGTHLVKRLLEQHRRVRLLTRSAPDELLSNSHVEIVVGDLGDPQAVDRAVNGVALVYHLGAAMKGAAEEFERSTELGTRHIVESVLRHKDTRLVHVSSLSVLHSSLAKPGDTVTETWPLEPHPERRGNYTLFKLQAERVVSNAVHERGLRAIIIRPGQVFGPGVELITPAVARSMGSRHIVLGDGSVPLPLVYVHDLIDALIIAGDRGPFDGTIIHVVDDGTSIDQNEFLQRIHQPLPPRPLRVPRFVVMLVSYSTQIGFRMIGRSSPLNPYRVRSALSSMKFDCSRAHTLLGWVPATGISQGLNQSVRSLDSVATNGRADSIPQSATWAE